MTIKSFYENASSKNYDFDGGHDQFLADAEDAFEFAHLPSEVKQKIHSMAWDAGHASGYYDVVNSYHDFVDLALLCYKSK